MDVTIHDSLKSMIHSISGNVKMALVPITVLSSPKVNLFAICLTVDLILLTICSWFFFCFFCSACLSSSGTSQPENIVLTLQVMCVPLEVSRAKPDPSLTTLNP